jgi:hypothetical protein
VNGPVLHSGKPWRSIEVNRCEWCGQRFHPLSGSPGRFCSSTCSGQFRAAYSRAMGGFAPFPNITTWQRSNLRRAMRAEMARIRGVIGRYS